MSYERDPVSVLFDAAARQLLARAYERPGEWVSTRLADPGPRHLAWCAAHGVNPYGPDNSSAAGGRSRRTDAKTRWARGFVRALWYQHRWYSGGAGVQGWRTGRRVVARSSSALEIEVGRAFVAAGVVPAGRTVRIRVRAGARAARAAVRRMPEQDRIFRGDGEPGARASEAELRDWR